METLFDTPPADDNGKIMAILQKNAKKDFVKRILNPDKYPEMKEGRAKATHLMSWAEVDGKYIVYPTIVNASGKLKKLEPDAAFEHAMKTGEAIEFSSPDEADWFSRNYKKVWGAKSQSGQRPTATYGIRG